MYQSNRKNELELSKPHLCLKLFHIKLCTSFQYDDCESVNIYM